MIINKCNTCSCIELPGITNNRGEQRKRLLRATVPKQFSFSLASWKTCSLRSRNSPSAFAMKFQCMGSSWGGLKRWPGTRGIVHTSWIRSGMRLGRKEDPTNNTFTARFCHCPELSFSFPSHALFILFPFRRYAFQSSELLFSSPEGSTSRRTCGGSLRSCTSGTTATPSKPPCCCGCRSPCGCACPWLCATAASVPWAQQVLRPSGHLCFSHRLFLFTYCFHTHLVG